jgi:hypothetical protein
MRRALAAATLAAGMASTPAWAQIPDIDSADYIMPGCHDYVSSEPSNAIFAAGLCVGTVRTLAFYAGELPPRHRFCFPEGATTVQAVLVVMAYIDKRPTRRPEPFASLAAEAMHEAWPCKE